MSRFLITLAGACLIVTNANAQETPDTFPLNAKRILFLGDSITHAGGYIAYLEAEYITRYGTKGSEFINLGLPSETCTGLSEPAHPWPRPNVHERLDRALSKLNPDVVVVCYGMNDGIYYPFSKERFEKFQAGIKLASKKITASGAKVILMTPTVFDPPRMNPKFKMLPDGAEEYSWAAPYKDYDSKVLKPYGDWILKQKKLSAMQVDLRTPLHAYLKDMRERIPKFGIAADGVHINENGHRAVAKAIANSWGIGDTLTARKELVDLVRKRQALLHNSLLSEVGHKRPGMKPGPPIKEAQKKASEIDRATEVLLLKSRD